MNEYCYLLKRNELIHVTTCIYFNIPTLSRLDEHREYTENIKL